MWGSVRGTQGGLDRMMLRVEGAGKSDEKRERTKTQMGKTQMGLDRMAPS